MRVLYISDDPRSATGYGRISHDICKYLRDTNHQVVVMGGINQPAPFAETPWEGITIWPVQGYGNLEQLRFLLRKEKSDAVLINADPRFFVENAFKIDNEIRRICPLVFYHLWDGDPFPEFNVPLYQCCDGIIASTKFTHNMLLNKAEQFGLPPIYYSPIGFDLSLYKPHALEDKVKFRKDFFKAVTGNKVYDENKVDFIIGFIGRFANRKRVPDIMHAFAKFAEGKDDVLLILHSTLQDEAGNLLYLQQKLFPSLPIIISAMGNQPNELINHLYNLFDVSVNLSNAEGFGMPLAESMAAGTPVITSKNAGPSGFVNEDNGWLLEPDVVTMVGSGITPYIYDNLVSIDSLVNTLEIAYKDRGLLRRKAQNCRPTIMREHNVIDMTRNIEKALLETIANFQQYPNYTLTTFGA